MRLRILFLALTPALLSVCSTACDIPVFRYAFDNWPADSFTATVFHRGDLSPADQALVSQIEASLDPEKSMLNLQVELFDLSNPGDRTPSLYEEAGSPSTPGLVLTYPGSSINSGPISAIPFEAGAVNALFDSPKRKELVSRLQAGESAVWVFLGCGEPEKDREAMALLESSLTELEGTLELPSVVDDPNAPADLLDSESGDGPPLRIDFSVLPVDREDPAEKLLVNLLLHSEPDLLEPDFASEPMTFPIYGRGRVLYALIGKGINPDVIQEACEFLVGPCSCQVKDLNPGSTDLLLAADWGELGEDPMQGMRMGGNPPGVGVAPAEGAPEGLSSNLIAVVAIQAILVLVISGILLLRRRSPSLG